ncbi:MAG: (deoxy)nucleoside triphosphate pyrophosphohydrolase [Thermodesulfobacteriota bacterium]|nr:(deoxy)nucleoside triphosphate pyrophosphohydrolase [Thermodesulfobacteriota bacterium]
MMKSLESEKYIDVAAAVFTQDELALVARRAPGQHLEYKWEFPGGKIKKNETPEACLQRELQEELGVLAKVGNFIGESVFSYPDKNIRLLAYHVPFWTGDFSLTVHDKIAWVNFQTLLDVDLAAADIPIASILQEKLLSEGKR